MSGEHQAAKSHYSQTKGSMVQKGNTEGVNDELHNAGLSPNTSLRNRTC